MNIEDQDFEKLRDYIKKVCGISIKSDKKYLIKQRLEPIVRSYGLKDFQELAFVLNTRPDSQLKQDVILSITTNETSFFRDIHPFETFNNVLLPEFGSLIKQNKARKIRIWSAGSSTGQEAYSLAMLIFEYVQADFSRTLRTDHFSIIGTDISTRALNKAMSAEYNSAELERGLSSERKNRYFRSYGKCFKLDSKIKNIVSFRQANFIDSLTLLGNFEIIFCRNVLIYFEQEMKKRILDQFYNMLSYKGYLFLGAMENTYNISDNFKTVRIGNTIIYQKG